MGAWLLEYFEQKQFTVIIEFVILGRTHSGYAIFSMILLKIGIEILVYN